MRGVGMEDKPPAPPLRFSSATSGGRQEKTPPGAGLMGLKPLPREPPETAKKKNKISNPFSSTKKSKEKDRLSDKPVISKPSNFEHTLHVGYDQVTGEFTGMPSDWARLLKDSQISKLEQQQNPQAVLDALKYYTRDQKPVQKWMQTETHFDSNGSLRDALNGGASPSASSSSSTLMQKGFSTSALPAYHYSLASPSNHYSSASPPSHYSSPSQSSHYTLASPSSHYSQHSLPSSHHEAQPNSGLSQYTQNNKPGSSNHGFPPRPPPSAGSNSNQKVQPGGLSHSSLSSAAQLGTEFRSSMPTYASSNATTVSTASNTPATTAHSSEPAPPIPDRPARTLSIYTKPKEEEELPAAMDQLGLGGQFGIQARNNPKGGRKKMSDAAVLAKLRTIVTIGNPDKKYRKNEKIGSGDWPRMKLGEQKKQRGDTFLGWSFKFICFMATSAMVLISYAVYTEPEALKSMNSVLFLFYRKISV